jgi:hypothetical protein
VRFSGLSVPCCLAETDFVGYGAGVAQLAERLICNGVIASEGRTASNGSVLAFFTSVLPSWKASAVRGKGRHPHRSGAKGLRGIAQATWLAVFANAGIGQIAPDVCHSMTRSDHRNASFCHRGP